MRLRSLACFFLVATTLLVVGQSNQQAIPAGTEVLIPDGTFFRAELTKGLDANKVKVDDWVKLKVLQDVRHPVRGLLIPKNAKLSARVSAVNAPKEKKERASLSIAIVGAEWKGGSAKLNGFITDISVPVGAAIGAAGGSAGPSGPTDIICDSQGTCRRSTTFAAPRRSVPSTGRVSWSPSAPPAVVSNGSLWFVSSDRHLPSGTIFGLQQGVPTGGPQGTPAKTSQSPVVTSAAAPWGTAQAQFKQGVMYYRGDGVKQDYVEAAAWFQKAAEQGVSPAQNALGVMFARGEGVPRDNVTAYMWFSLGSAADANQNKDRLQVLESLMTPEQIAEGKRRTEEWLKQHPASR